MSNDHLFDAAGGQGQPGGQQPAPENNDGGQENVQENGQGQPAKPENNLTGENFLDAFRGENGEVDVAKLSQSYQELQASMPKVDQLKEEWAKEYNEQLLAGRPETVEAYEIGELPEGFIASEDIEQNEMFQWWRETCFENGKDQAFFQAGIGQFLGFLNEIAPDPKQEFEALGPNAEARVNSVALWANQTFPAGEMDAIRILGTTADGIAALERIMKISTGGTAFDQNNQGDLLTTKSRLTRAQVDEMMQSPKYWDAGQRDPEWVKKIEEANAYLAASG